jgi:ATP-dependent Clp protease ATP-binding subunit ClpA
VFERFTQPARRVVELAEEEADRLGHNYLGPEHVLLGIVRDDESRAAGVLQAYGLDLAAARVEVGRLVDQGSCRGPSAATPSCCAALGSTWRRCDARSRTPSGVRPWTQRPGA